MEKNPDTKSLMPLTDPLALPGPLSIIWSIIVFSISSLCPSSIICLGVCDIFVRPTPCGNNVAPYCSHSHSTLPISGKGDSFIQIRRQKKPTIVVAKPYRRRSSGPHMHTRHERPKPKTPVHPHIAHPLANKKPFPTIPPQRRKSFYTDAPRTQLRFLLQLSLGVSAVWLFSPRARLFPFRSRLLNFSPGVFQWT